MYFISKRRDGEVDGRAGLSRRRDDPAGAVARQRDLLAADLRAPEEDAERRVAGRRRRRALLGRGRRAAASRQPPPGRYNESALKQDNSSGYAALRSGAGLVDRSVLGRLLLTGADRRSYLQGLLTNDIEALTPGTGCYAAMLTAQGRMMTDMRVLELGDAVLLDVPALVTTRDPRRTSTASSSAKTSRSGRHRGARRDRALRAGAAATVVTGAPTRDQTSRRFHFSATSASLVAIGDVMVVRSDEPGVDGYDVVLDSGGARH